MIIEEKNPAQSCNPVKKPLRFGSVCSGIEAASAAWIPLGWQCQFVSEIEKFPCAVLAHHHPEVPNFGDMTRFREWNEKHTHTTIDLLVGGTPCQAFSVAGLRKGLADPRGNLALTFLAIVDQYRPRWVVWENVPGVHSSWSDEAAFGATEEGLRSYLEARRLVGESGIDLGAEFGADAFEEVDQANDFDCFLGGLEELGYGVATRVLDAQYFGVPQRRRRVFVVGHIGGEWQRAAAVLFERESLCGNPPPRRETRERASADVSPCIGASGRGFERTGETRGQDPVVACAIQEDNQNGICIRDTTGSLRSDAPGHQPCGTLIGEPIPIGIDGGDVAFARSANASHSGDKGDGGMNTTAVIENLKLQNENCDIAHAETVGPLMTHSTPNGHGAAGVNNQQVYSGHIVPEVLAHGQGNAERVSDGEPSLTCNHEAPIAFIPGGVSVPANRLVSSLAPPSATAYRTSGNCGVMEQGDKTAALNTATDPCQNIVMTPPIAFSAKDSGGDAAEEVSPTLRAGNHDKSHANSGNWMATTHGMAVRRLTPKECERLQGFPDDYTQIPWGKKPAEECPDGPRYKALGNSMAVPVMRWIGERIMQVDAIP